MSFGRYYTANDMEIAPPPYNQGPFIPIPTMPLDLGIPDLDIPYEDTSLRNDAVKPSQLYDSYQGTFYIDAPPVIPEDKKSHTVKSQTNQPPTPPPTQQPLPSSQELQDPILTQTTSWIPRTAPPPSTHFLRLEKPVVIPRLDITHKHQLPLPFQRCYAPILAFHDISSAYFLSFIDNLAIAQAISPPLQALAIAGPGAAAAIKIRTKEFLEVCNERFFGPRGLKAAIMKDEDVARCVRVGMWDDVLAPVDAGCITLRDRRMKALEPYIASLRFDVPPPTAQRGLLDRLGAKQIEARMTRAEKKEREKVMKREKSTRRESVSSDESDDFWTEMKKLERKIQIMNLKAEEELEEKGKRKAERIEERRLRDIIKKLETGSESSNKKGDKKEIKEKAKELEQVAQMEYIVIENL